MTILENDMTNFSCCWTNENISDDDNKETIYNCFITCGESREVRPFKCDKCNEELDILDLTLKEFQRVLNELKR